MTHADEPRDGFLQVQGRRIHYLEAGVGAPLILLHSNGGSSYEFEDAFQYLASRFRAIAWDMPGQGDSDPLERHLSVDEYADSVIAFMDGLGIGTAFVAGASIGGAICVSLAARHAKRLSRPVIVECPFRSAAEWKNMWLTTEANYSQTTQARDKVAPRLKELSDHHFARWNIDRNKAGTKTMLSVMWALREYKIDDALRRIEPEGCLIFGEKGPTVAKLEAFRSALRRSRSVVLPGCGHFPMIDDPSAFAKAIFQFAEI